MSAMPMRGPKPTSPAKPRRSKPAPAPAPPTDDRPALERLAAMHGLVAVMAWANDLHARITLDKERPAAARVHTLGHLVLVGNPGTGKTTVARILGQLLAELGARAKGFTETTGQALLTMGVAESRKVMSSACGVLFVDEAHQLRPHDDVNGRAITYTLMDACRRTDLTVIVAGYVDDMDKFLASDPGLASRFGDRLVFEDLTEAQLRQVFVDEVAKSGWALEAVDDVGTDAASVAARPLALRAGSKGFANARSVKNLVDKAKNRASARVFRERIAGGALTATLTRDDVLGPPCVAAGPIFDELRGLIGQQAVKQAVASLVAVANASRQDEERGLPPLSVSLHRLFLGPPGTGKTTVAEIYGKILGLLGFLSIGGVEKASASQLIGTSVGDAEAKTREAIDRARGKVLVIDEAYLLAESDSGKQALGVLVECVQGVAGEDLAVIMCGYEGDMKRMLREGNAGLAGRFRVHDAFIFEDYNDAELQQILLSKAQAARFDVTGEVASAAVANVVLIVEVKVVAESRVFVSAAAFEAWRPHWPQCRSGRYEQTHGLPPPGSLGDGSDARHVAATPITDRLADEFRWDLRTAAEVCEQAEAQAGCYARECERRGFRASHAMPAGPFGGMTVRTAYPAAVVAFGPRVFASTGVGAR